MTGTRTFDLRSTLSGAGVYRSSLTSVCRISSSDTAPLGSLTRDQMSDRPSWHLEVGDGVAPWMKVFERDVNRIATYGSNWDSYGGEPLREKATLRAVELLTSLDFGGPAPWVSPSPDGYLHVEWQRGAYALELEVDDVGDVEVVVDDGVTVDEWRTSSLGDDRLRSALQRISYGVLE